MAGRGPAPKDPSERRRRNADPVPTTVLKPSTELCGPSLPESVDWPDATLSWWETWRRSPQAATFTDTDWSFLLDTAMLHMAFWAGDTKAAAELRLRVAKFGATPEDRARLRMEVASPAETEPKVRQRTPAARTRRARLLKAVGDDG